jgi:vesicle coat complex subunit
MSEVTKIDARTAVETIISRAEKSKNPDEAVKFSQAACNTANAFRILFDMDLYKDTPTT